MPQRAPLNLSVQVPIDLLRGDERQLRLLQALRTTRTHAGGGGQGQGGRSWWEPCMRRRGDPLASVCSMVPTHRAQERLCAPGYLQHLARHVQGCGWHGRPGAQRNGIRIQDAMCLLFACATKRRWEHGPHTTQLGTTDQLRAIKRRKKSRHYYTDPETVPAYTGNGLTNALSSSYDEPIPMDPTFTALFRDAPTKSKPGDGEKVNEHIQLHKHWALNAQACPKTLVLAYGHGWHAQEALCRPVGRSS